MPNSRTRQVARPRRTTLKRRVLGVFVALAGLILVAFWHIGYFGGPIFTNVPAAVRTPSNRAGLVAIVFSGDAGYQIGMPAMIGNRLAAAGIPVVGVNMLTYFRTTRSPADATRLVGTAINHAIAFAHADHVILIGQSYGADMLHVGLAKLPVQLRDKVQLVELVVPGSTIEFRATPGGILSFNVLGAPALLTSDLLTWSPVVCIQGVEETASLCPLLTSPNVAKIVLPGGHPLHWDADGLTVRLLAAIDTSARNITKVSDYTHATVIP